MSTYQHTCGQIVMVGEKFLGYQLMPTFHVDGKYVNFCPTCGARLRLDHTLEKADSIRKELQEALDTMSPEDFGEWLANKVLGESTAQ